MHLDEGTIHAWLDGALDAEEAARVQRHAAECGACAAAVAEARGLVAGASRILTALDGVPAGVVPKSAESGRGRDTSSTRRTRSLWATLHLTPARAAAAAVVFLAAGAALVVRNAPNEARRNAITLADYPRAAAVTVSPAAPPVSKPVAPVDSATSHTTAAPSAARPAPRMTLAEAAPAPAPASSRRMSAKATGQVAGVPVAGKANEARVAQVAASDSARGDLRADSIASRKESAMARSAVADNALRGAVAGAAPRAAASRPAAASQSYLPVKALADARSIAGCYAVTTDSTLAFPPRLWLDGTLVAQLPVTQQRERAPLADPAVLEQYVVSEIVNDARRSLRGAYWAPRGDGSIRLSLPAITRSVDLRVTPESTLVGVMAIGDRVASVTLRRTECGTR